MYLQIDHTVIDYFFAPMVIIFIRDVSEKVRSNILQRRNIKREAVLQRMKLSTETLSHDMRAPLASIIMIMDILLSKKHKDKTNF